MNIISGINGFSFPEEVYRVLADLEKYEKEGLAVTLDQNSFSEPGDDSPPSNKINDALIKNLREFVVLELIEYFEFNEQTLELAVEQNYSLSVLQALLKKGVKVTENALIEAVFSKNPIPKINLLILNAVPCGIRCKTIVDMNKDTISKDVFDLIQDEYQKQRIPSTAIRV